MVKTCTLSNTPMYTDKIKEYRKLHLEMHAFANKHQFEKKKLQQISFSNTQDLIMLWSLHLQRNLFNNLCQISILVGLLSTTLALMTGWLGYMCIHVYGWHIIGYNQGVTGCGSQRRQCSCYSTKTNVNSMILILKLHLTSLRNICIKSGLRWTPHTF